MRLLFFSAARGIAAFAIFVMAYAGMNEALDSLIAEPEVPVFTEKLHLLETKYRESDVLFVGSSRVMHQIEPRVFESVISAAGGQVRSFNLGMDSMWPPESLFVLRELLQRPLPKLRWVFIELMKIDGTLRKGQDETERVLYWHDFYHTLLAQRAVLERDERWSYRLPLLWRHEALWLKKASNLGEGTPLLRQRLWPAELTELEPTWVQDAGYRAARDKALAGEDLAWFQQTLREEGEILKQQAVPLPPSLRRELSPLVAALQARGVQPVFFISPGLDSEANYREAPAGAPLLSFARPDLYPELFSPALFRDRSHLNPKGTAIFTRLLAQKFMEMTRLKP